MTVKAQAGLDYIDKKRDLLIGVCDSVWRFAEVALHEVNSAKCLVDALTAEGFEVKQGISDMPTAFVATWGSGRPIIGFIGEYDALAGLSQDCVPTRKELTPGAAGHGCGHNLLGTGGLGAALGLKAELTARGMSGTVRYYGCPAEENLSGKAFMARDGVFDDCDVCLGWHPGAVNRVSNGSSLANNAANFTFFGRSAHAAGDPHNGRSALDAVQLMNLGVEFLREHVSTKSRVHYVITNGGGQPNVVPPEASVWYLVRATERAAVDDLWERIHKCAAGAATMTDTRYEMELLKAIWNVLPNDTLINLLDECFQRVGAPQFSPEDRQFAKEIVPTFGGTKIREEQVPEEVAAGLLCDVVLPKATVQEEPRHSTDMGDVSWCCPVGQIRTACYAIGTPGHSWQAVAQAGMGIGQAGAIQAAKVLTEAGFELASNPHKLEQVKAEFKRRTANTPYKSAMPPGQKPAFHQFRSE